MFQQKKKITKMTANAALHSCNELLSVQACNVQFMILKSLFVLSQYERIKSMYILKNNV